MLYRDVWPSVLKTEDHQHEVGEDTTKCANCQLARAAGQLSEFEVAVWNWYWENVTMFTLRAGAVAALIAEETRGVSRQTKAFFIRALSMIDATMEAVDVERRKIK